MQWQAIATALLTDKAVQIACCHSYAYGTGAPCMYVLTHMPCTSSAQCAESNHAGVKLSSKVFSIMTSDQHAGFQLICWLLMHLAVFSGLSACSIYAYGICLEELLYLSSEMDTRLYSLTMIHRTSLFDPDWPIQLLAMSCDCCEANPSSSFEARHQCNPWCSDTVKCSTGLATVTSPAQTNFY